MDVLPIHLPPIESPTASAPSAPPGLSCARFDARANVRHAVRRASSDGNFHGETSRPSANPSVQNEHMPESPEVQVLAEFLDGRLSGRTVQDVDLVEFRALKTRARPLSTLTGQTRRGRRAHRQARRCAARRRAPGRLARPLRLGALGRRGSGGSGDDPMPRLRSRSSRSTTAAFSRRRMPVAG